MAKIRELIKKPLVTLGLGFLAGLIVGLPLLGWLVFPVEWTDAAPTHLRQDLKEDYMRMAIQAYSVDRDREKAQSRWTELGADAPEILKTLQSDPKLDTKQLSEFGNLVGIVSAVPPPFSGTAIVGGSPVEEMTAVPTLPPFESMLVEPEENTTINPLVWISIICVLLLLVGGAAFYMLVLRKRVRGEKSPVYHNSAIQTEEGEYETDSLEDELPIGQFMTNFVLGDDAYDDSFSVDSQNGEFLGECGAGVSDTIGVGGPKKVSAIEVWLFDKNDIQTITKVFMSEHAYNDLSIRQRLASKGEPVLVRPNERLLLETESLQMEARVVDLAYGEGALPPNSFFDRLSLELTVWRKGH
jgi:hypothetical protein